MSLACLCLHNFQAPEKKKLFLYDTVKMNWCRFCGFLLSFFVSVLLQFWDSFMLAMRKKNHFLI